MKLLYMGKFGGEETLPTRKDVPDAVQFREPKNMKTFALYANLLSLPILILLAALFFLRARNINEDGFISYFSENGVKIYIGCVLSVVTFFPHEFLHAICFKNEVELYTNLKQGILFVIGTEDMSKSRFVFMSLLPNLVFGLIPFIAFLIFPEKLAVLGALGVIGISSGAGDYMNIFNCLTQVPKNSCVFMSGVHSYHHPKN